MPGVTAEIVIMSTAKVFLTERLSRDLDLSTALVHGDLAFFFDRDDRRSSIFRTKEFCADLLKSFARKGFRPDLDYFCVAGKLIPVSMALAMLTGRYGEVRILLYNAESEGYVPRALSSRDCFMEQGSEQGKGDEGVDRMPGPY